MQFPFQMPVPEEKRVPKMNRVRCKFTKQEDILLVNVVNELGTRDWEAIANRIPNRNARQCRERYTNYLAPNLSHDPWTPEEDSLLEQKLKELGAKWVNISKYFKNRTDTMLKNRWLVLSRRSPHLAKHTPNLQNINSSHQKGNYKKQQAMVQMNPGMIPYPPQMQIPNMQGIPIPPQMKQITPVPPPQQEIMLPPPITTPQNSEEQHPKRPLPSLCNLVGKLIQPLQKANFNFTDVFDIDKFTKNFTKPLF